MSSNILNFLMALPKIFTLEFWDFSSFTLNDIFPNAHFSKTIEFQRPIFLLFLIPALIISIIPFFRLRKNRRRASKHIIPFIIHLALILAVTALMTDVRITEESTIPPETVIIVACDVSDSNQQTRDRMNDYIKYLYEKSKDTKIGVILFADGQVVSAEIGEKRDNYFDFDFSSIGLGATNIKAALDFAREQFPDNDKVNKRIILLSDGRETKENAWLGVETLLNNKVRLDAVYFDMLANASEIQLSSLKTNNTIIRRDSKVSMTIVIDSNIETTGVITIHEGDNVVHQRNVSLKKGSNSLQFEYTPEGIGLHTIYASFTPDREENDSITENNQLYSWFKVEDMSKILIVDGDGTQVSNRNVNDITKLISDDEYITEITNPAGFPDTMEKLLDYDEVVLMNVNFKEMPNGAADILTRYVEELGRGLFITCGTNTYDMDNLTVDGGNLAEIAELLPVDLNIRETRQKIAFVLTVDMSSSMREMMGSKSRYEVAKESAKNCLDALVEENAYVGIVLFDSNASVAIEMTSIAEIDWIKAEIDRTFDEYFYLHDENGNKVKKSEALNTTVTQPDGTKFNVNNNTPAEYVNDYVVRTYNTGYRLATLGASSLLSSFDADIKQMVFISDGEPTDSGSGYVNIVQNMARQGIVTYSLGISASLNANAIRELTSIANAGNGQFKQVNDAESLDKTLFEIARIKGETKNDAEIRGEPIEPRFSDTSSKVLLGIKDMVNLGGYYGSTTKEGAKKVIVVDDDRPIYAEWERGLGKVAMFMTDLSNPKWTGDLWADKDGYQFITNMFVATLNDRAFSTGITYNSKRDNDNVNINVTLLDNLRDGEELVVVVRDEEGNQIERITLTKKNFGRYSGSVYLPDVEKNYNVTITIEKEIDTLDKIQDRVEFRIVGTYGEEYNVFARNNGQNSLNDWSIRTGGVRFLESSDNEDLKFQNLGKDSKTLYDYSQKIKIPFTIIVLTLFVLEIIFRNVNISRKKKHEMTDEEQIASMRGR